MPRQIVLLATLALTLATASPSTRAGDADKVDSVGKGNVHEVGTGLEIKGQLGKTKAITYQVKLVAGKTYVIDMISANQKALDPFLRLLDAGGKELAEDDDGGEGLNARIVYKVDAPAIFQVVATCFGTGRGTFTLTICEAKEGDRALTREDQEKLGQRNTHRNQANQLLANGMLAEAVVALENALALEKAVRGNLHNDVVASLGVLARIHESREDFTEARKTRMEVMSIQTKIHGPAHWKVTDARLALANTNHLSKMEPAHRVLAAKALQWNGKLAALQQAGKTAEALKLAQESLAMRKQALGEKNADYARSLNTLAFFYSAQANYAKGEPLLRQALEIRKEVLGEKHPDYANSLNSLASLYNALRNFAKAEPLFRQALEIQKEVLGEKHPGYANSLNGLAVSYNEQGNYAKAEPLFRQALDIKKEVLGEKHPDYALSLNNLAYLYDFQENYAKAEPLFRQALGIFREVLGEKHPDYATGLNNLAFTYNAQGNHAQAEPLYRQALEIRKEVLGEKHLDVALGLNNLAFFHDSQRDYAKAEPLYRQALVALQMKKEPVAIEHLKSDDLRIHPFTVMVLSNHALFLHKTIGKGASSKERRYCDRSCFLALTILDRVRDDYRDAHESKTLLTAEQFELFLLRITTLQQLFTLEQNVQDLEAAFWTAEQGTARTFLEALGTSRANFLAGVSPALQAAESQLLQDIRLLDLRIDTESARTLEQRNPDLIGALLVQRKGAEADFRKLIARIETQHPQYAGLKYPRPCKLEEARACLAPDEVALLFVPGTDASFIVLVEARPTPWDKANGLAIIELPGRAVLAEHVAALNDLDTLALPARVKALGRDAYDAILGPCKERIEGKHLVIVPLDSLCQLPFELLVAPDGKYLVEKHRIRYAPSLTALHLINLWKQKRVPPQVPLFAVGDPLYDVGEKVASAAVGDGLRELLWREGKTPTLKRLIHSSTEVAEIADLLGAKKEYVLTGADASEAKVKAASAADQMAEARYVHFATHGILGADKGKQPALVLNLVGNSSEDGFLHMDEITSLKLNADLVVLSACRTGQGRMARGEGVSGLARAFLYAGSKGVVCSLWSVDDRETANLMVDFYRHLQKGRPAAEALRDAQLAMIRAGKAPLYWAPFILIGE